MSAFSRKFNFRTAMAVLFLTAIPAMVLLPTGCKAEDKAKEKTEAPAAKKDDAPVLKLGDPVVANIDGTDIKRSEVFAFISTLPEQVRQMPVQTLFPLALEQVINNKVVGTKADAAKLGDDPDVQKTLEEAKQQIIRNVFVERQVDAEMSQKKLLDSYNDLLTSLPDVEELHARHILVDSEEKAREIIKKLDDGAKFEDLANENSTGPSAKNGGDLGYFAQSEMVPEFASAAFGLAAGSYTKDPVKTQFGWHVIKAEDKRKRPQPTFEQVKPQLEVQLRQKILNDLLSKWQKDAKIKKFDINGDPVKEAKETKKKK